MPQVPYLPPVSVRLFTARSFSNSSPRSRQIFSTHFISIWSCIFDCTSIDSLLQIRDPYPVLVARNWARDMAGLETCLCLGVLFFLACVKFISGDSGDVASSSEPLVEDDDDFTVAGVGLTSHVALRASSGLEWADVAVAPFAAKGLLLVLEIGAVACACSGACLACCCHVKCGALQEGDVLTTLGWCSGFSALATAASLVFTALCLLYKWERAMDNNEIGGTLLIMSL